MSGLYRVERRAWYPTFPPFRSRLLWELVGYVDAGDAHDARREARESFGTARDIGEIRVRPAKEDE